MKIDHLHIVCFKWKKLYSAADVNTLRAMVARNLTVPHTFHCVTDDPKELDPAIVAHPLILPERIRHDIGNGRKLQSFGTDFLGLEGQFAVISDIDVVIVGNLDFLADRPDQDFLITRGHLQFANTRGHSAFYRIKIGSHAYLWDWLVADPEGAATTCQHHRGAPGHISDQRWLDRQVETMNFFPDGKIVYFRHHCSARGQYVLGKLGERLGLSTALFGIAAPPPGAAVVSFAGQPKPQMVAHRHHDLFRRAPFVAKHWRV